MESPKTLQEAILHYADYENCRQFMISTRWPDGVVRCPQCQSHRVTYLIRARVYKCAEKHPRQKFSLKVGTIFEDSPIPLHKWLPAVWLISNDKNGISSWEVHRAFGVTQKTAWFMLHRIRLAMKGPDFLLGGQNGGEVEIDETYIGGLVKNMHKSRKLAIEQERSRIRNHEQSTYYGKTPVQGMLDRELRKVRAQVVPNVRRDALQAQILNSVQYGSTVYSDSAVMYDGLNDHFLHAMVNHAEHYVMGRVHTNGLENFWSLLKRTLKGTYVAVEPFHLDRYVDEQVFRYNNRATKGNPLNDADRFYLAMSQIVEKRLTYKELTGKDGATQST